MEIEKELIAKELRKHSQELRAKIDNNLTNATCTKNFERDSEIINCECHAIFKLEQKYKKKHDKLVRKYSKRSTCLRGCKICNRIRNWLHI